MAKSEYRNSIRSKAMIRASFAELLKEKSFGEISISDVVLKADIARATFYAHFKDTKEVLYALIESTIDEVAIMLESIDSSNYKKNIKHNFEIISAYIAKNLKYAKSLTCADRECGVSSIFIDEISEKLSFLKDKESMAFLLSGIYYFYRDIIDEKASISLMEAPSVLESFFISILETAIAK